MGKRGITKPESIHTLIYKLLREGAASRNNKVHLRSQSGKTLYRCTDFKLLNTAVSLFGYSGCNQTCIRRKEKNTRL
jgi:hypothetical protein